MFAQYFALLALVAIAGCVHVNAPPSSESITTLTADQVAAYKPYTFYAKAAYCPIAAILKWTCGSACHSNPAFGNAPISVGGDSLTGYTWYVGYDSQLESVIVSYQGANILKIINTINNLDFAMEPLDPSLFPKLDSRIQAHKGFAAAQAHSARNVHGAVQAIFDNKATKVTLVGHSIGGVLALLTSIYLPLHLPSGIDYSLVTYGAPRVGNKALADYVNTHGTNVSRINNRHDPVPILIPKTLGYRHVNGEIHITDSLDWVNCPGEENSDRQCTKRYIVDYSGRPDAFQSFGPYDGVLLGDCYN